MTMMDDDEEEKIMLQNGGMRILKPSTIPSIIEAHHRFCRKAVPGNIKSLLEKRRHKYVIIFLENPSVLVPA